MEAVARQHGAKVIRRLFGPVFHELVARHHRRSGFLAHLRDDIHETLVARRVFHSRKILRIEQDDFHLLRFHEFHAELDEGAERLLVGALHGVIGADLPDDEIEFLRRDPFFKPRHGRVGGLAIHARVDDIDVGAELLFEILLEAGGIGMRGCGRADAARRGRADRQHMQAGLGRDALGEILQPGLFGEHGLRARAAVAGEGVIKGDDGGERQKRGADSKHGGARGAAAMLAVRVSFQPGRFQHFPPSPAVAAYDLDR